MISAGKRWRRYKGVGVFIMIVYHHTSAFPSRCCKLDNTLSFRGRLAYTQTELWFYCAQAWSIPTDDSPRFPRLVAVVCSHWEGSPSLRGHARKAWNYQNIFKRRESRIVNKDLPSNLRGRIALKRTTDC